MRAETSTPAQDATRVSGHAVEATLFARSEPELDQEQRRRWQQHDEGRSRNRKRNADEELAIFNLEYVSEANT
jgi:hypothetical protein